MNNEPIVRHQFVWSNGEVHVENVMVRRVSRDVCPSLASRQPTQRSHQAAGELRRANQLGGSTAVLERHRGGNQIGI